MPRPMYQVIAYENLAGLLEDHISDPMQAFWVEVTSKLKKVSKAAKKCVFVLPLYFTGSMYLIVTRDISKITPCLLLLH